MLTDPSEAAREHLERVLRDLYPDAERVVEAAAGGFLVALVSPIFNGHSRTPIEMERLFQRLSAENQSIPDPQDRIVVFSMFFYPDHEALFDKRGALRIRRDSRDDSGILTRHSSYGDMSLRVHVLDAEALLIDRPRRRRCRAIQDLEFPTPYDIGDYTYLQFDVGGHVFDVEEVRRAAKGTIEVVVK
jgi:hypothetical protein